MYMVIKKKKKKTARPSDNCSPYAGHWTVKGKSVSEIIWVWSQWEEISEAWDKVDILFLCQVFENDKGIHYQLSCLPNFKLID